MIYGKWVTVMKGNNQEFIAEGYSFQNANDALLAVQERKKTDYLEAKMDYSRLESILNVYNKAVEDRVFRTPAGTAYLKKLQEYLILNEMNEDRILPIPIDISYSAELRDKTSPARIRITPSEKKKTNFLPLSILLNFLFAAAIVVMLTIALKSEEPNIFNYKQAVTDQYAQWDQELTEREEAVREKERELKIEVEK